MTSPNLKIRLLLEAVNEELERDDGRRIVEAEEGSEEQRQLGNYYAVDINTGMVDHPRNIDDLEKWAKDEMGIELPAIQPEGGNDSGVAFRSLEGDMNDAERWMDELKSIFSAIAKEASSDQPDTTQIEALASAGKRLAQEHVDYFMSYGMELRERQGLDPVA